MADSNESGASVEPLYSDLAGDEDMMELVEFFVDELQQRIDALKTAMQQSDESELKTLAHQLKGAAGGYGFPSISECAGDVEQGVMACEGDIASVTEKVEALINLCRRASC